MEVRPAILDLIASIRATLIECGIDTSQIITGEATDGFGDGLGECASGQTEPAGEAYSGVGRNIGVLDNGGSELGLGSVEFSGKRF